MKEILVVTGTLLLFAVVHSLFAAEWMKQRAVGLFGADRVRGLYRLGYTLLSILSLTAVGAVIGTIPDVTLFSLPPPVRLLLRVSQVALLLFAAAGFRVFSSGRFLGLPQSKSYFSGRDIGGDVEGLEEGALTREGVYGLVRHPMYSAGILFFLLSPTWTRTWLIVRLLAIAYFVAGSLLEEHRLLRKFGMEYRRYMEEVPRFLPRLPAAGTRRR